MPTRLNAEKTECLQLFKQSLELITIQDLKALLVPALGRYLEASRRDLKVSVGPGVFRKCPGKFSNFQFLYNHRDFKSTWCSPVSQVDTFYFRLPGF